MNTVNIEEIVMILGYNRLSTRTAIVGLSKIQFRRWK